MMTQVYKPENICVCVVFSTVESQQILGFRDVMQKGGDGIS